MQLHAMKVHHDLYSSSIASGTSNSANATCQETLGDGVSMMSKENRMQYYKWDAPRNSRKLLMDIM